MKTEYGRRKKVIEFMNDIIERKQRWTVDIVIRFLTDRYQAHSKTPRISADWLNKGRTREILDAAQVYCT